VNSSVKRSSSEEQASTVPLDDDEVLEEEEEQESPQHENKSVVTTTATTATTVPLPLPLPIPQRIIYRPKPIPKIKYPKKFPSFTSKSLVAKNTKSSSLKWSSSGNTRKYPEPFF
jgi:hypothetical protein